jgi:hypothetical protein
MDVPPNAASAMDRPNRHNGHRTEFCFVAGIDRLLLERRLRVESNRVLAFRGVHETGAFTAGENTWRIL